MSVLQGKGRALRQPSAPRAGAKIPWGFNQRGMAMGPPSGSHPQRQPHGPALDRDPIPIPHSPVCEEEEEEEWRRASCQVVR